MAYICTANACLSAHSLGWNKDGTRAARILLIERNQNRKSGAKRTPMGYSRPLLGITERHSSIDTIRRDRQQISGRRRSRSVALAAAASSQQEKEIVRLPISVEYISSPTNPYVKHLVRLRQNPRTRSATESVLVVGTIPLREICESVGETVERKTPSLVDVLLVREDAQKAPEELARVSRRIVRVSSDAMSKLSGLDSPPEVAGVLPFPPSFVTFPPYRNSNSSGVQMRKWCSSPRRILVLDSIQDPGNMGTLLRTAAAFGWDGVFLLHGCCDPFNDKALRASRGASFRVPIGIGEWDHVREFANANQLKLYAGDPEPGAGSAASGYSPSPMDGQFTFPEEYAGRGLCLVLGSEGQGLSDNVIRHCVPVGIPMPGNFESLNVAVAGGILMFLLR